MQLAGGVDASYPHADEFLRLYGVVSRSLSLANLDETEGALRMIRAMRQAVARLRDEAVGLERAGVVPPAGERLVCTTA
jgi:hypothetical protein